MAELGIASAQNGQVLVVAAADVTRAPDPAATRDGASGGADGAGRASTLGGGAFGHEAVLHPPFDSQQSK